jgi:hypothetical protein
MDMSDKTWQQFEEGAFSYFKGRIGDSLMKGHSVELGLNGNAKKPHRFDFGSEGGCPILVECKYHRWTEGRNVPSAKMSVWNEAMYYFHLAPKKYAKYMVVLRDLRETKTKNESLADYYLRTYDYLIPHDVIFLECDADFNDVKYRKVYDLVWNPFRRL